MTTPKNSTMATGGFSVYFLLTLQRVCAPLPMISSPTLITSCNLACADLALCAHYKGVIFRIGDSYNSGGLYYTTCKSAGGKGA